MLYFIIIILLFSIQVSLSGPSAASFIKRSYSEFESFYKVKLISASPINTINLFSFERLFEDNLWGNPSFYDLPEVPHIQKKKRDYSGYDAERPYKSNWYNMYVARVRLKTREEKKFRRRFRMPREQVDV